MTTPITPGSSTTEHTLSLLAAFAGLLMVAGGAALQALHPVGDLGATLIHYGVLLAGGSTVTYGGLRTALKMAALVNRYEPVAEQLATAIPGQVGSDIRILLPIVHKMTDALNQIALTNAAPVPPAPSPAAQVLEAARTVPIAPAAAPTAPGAA